MPLLYTCFGDLFRQCISGGWMMPRAYPWAGNSDAKSLWFRTHEFTRRLTSSAAFRNNSGHTGFSRILGIFRQGKGPKDCDVIGCARQMIISQDVLSGLYFFLGNFALVGYSWYLSSFIRIVLTADKKKVRYFWFCNPINIETKLCFCLL